ncbi:MAG TPA: nucleotide disphospho-sugar-binding domain-containing protein [Pyrinomonadaceae bacterium]|jgi:UDP:flavonoid glycosyltransferase YjiC (YdhE family)|nr:nucleotide disphospho-sugar-binding domain-containing protein [Pyrinomonadaceae bacterium]
MPESLAGKKIVIATWGSFGDLHPYMALALELKGRGHRPVIATSPFYREKIEAAGISFHKMRPDLPAPGSQEADEMVRRATNMRDGPRYVFQELLMAHIRETYQDAMAAVNAEGGADLLLTHTVPPIGALVAETSGVKWVSTVLAPIPFASAYDPPTIPQYPYLRSVVKLHPAISKVFFALGKKTTWSWWEPVRRLRRDLGLPEGENPIFDGQHSPTLVLALFSNVLAQVQPDFPPRTLITGFPFYDLKDEEATSPELMCFLDEGEPPVLFTLGSSAVWIAKDFYDISIEAARRLKLRALLLIGDERNRPQLPLPAGIAAFDYAPHSLVMPRSSLIVHQGGIGTTGQALRAGKPMLVVPYGQDQPDNARRCAELGVARVLPRSRYHLQNVLDQLSDLRDRPAYSIRAAEIGRRVREEDGTSRACDAIEEVLMSSKRVYTSA